MVIRNMTLSNVFIGKGTTHSASSHQSQPSVDSDVTSIADSARTRPPLVSMRVDTAPQTIPLSSTAHLNEMRQTGDRRSNDSTHTVPYSSISNKVPRTDGPISTRHRSSTAMSGPNRPTSVPSSPNSTTRATHGSSSKPMP